MASGRFPPICVAAARRLRRRRKAAAWCWAGAAELLGSEEDLVAPIVRWARGVMAALVAVAGGSACRRRLDPGAAALEGGGG